VEEFVHFTGFRRDIPNIQAALDIYTLASVKGEMFPNSILEAMAMGNPWVASNLSGIRKYRKTAEMDFCQSRTTAKILRTN